MLQLVVSDSHQLYIFVQQLTHIPSLNNSVIGSEYQCEVLPTQTKTHFLIPIPGSQLTKQLCLFYYSLCIANWQEAIQQILCYQTKELPVMIRMAGS